MNAVPALPFRIGQGWDSHRIEAGRPLILGGIHIPSEFGLAGHSDADVLFHCHHRRDPGRARARRYRHAFPGYRARNGKMQAASNSSSTP